MRAVLLILLLVVAPIGLVAFLYLRSRNQVAVLPVAIAGTNSPAAYAAAATAGPVLIKPVPPAQAAASAISQQTQAAAAIAEGDAAAARTQGVVTNIVSSAETAAAEKAGATVLQPLVSSTGPSASAVDWANANPDVLATDNYSYTATGEVSGIQAGLKTIPGVGSLAAGAVGLLNTVGNALGALGIGAGTVNANLAGVVNSAAHGKGPSTARQISAGAS